jgi:3D (Asp-Asp-Asp) domain-containing protein
MPEPSVPDPIDTGMAGARLASTTAIAGLILALSVVQVGADAEQTRELEVTATAYNSIADQTNDQPNLTAWGDRLVPGMKSIAVSRDLIEMGLTHGAEVEIDGLEGVYVVRDKMAKRWQRKIDIYMGEDVKAARSWGRRRVTIRFKTPG